MDAEQREKMARELLAVEAENGGWPRWAAAIREGRTDSIDGVSIRAIARALTQAQPGWLGIESAPRDGTRIILAWPCGLVEQGFCLDNSKSMKPWAGFRVESMRPWPPEQPHKWMPLPAAPAPQQGEG